MAGGELRRSVTLAERLSSSLQTPSSVILADLLKLPETNAAGDARAAGGRREETTPERRSSSLGSGGVSLELAVASDMRNDADERSDGEGNGRTLLDVIRAEQPGAGIAAWRSLVDLISAGRSNPIPPTGEPSADQAVATTTADQEDQQRQEEEQPERVSLMALLEQTDRHWSDMDGGGDKVLLQEVSGDQTDTGVGIHECNCCVCMVRRKGAAFIPCGHTFCRSCSRQLRSVRGSCPLCNALIIDILDIF